MYNDKTWDRNKLKCPQCQYTCEYRSNLNRHTKSKHTNLVKLKCANQNAQCTFLMNMYISLECTYRYQSHWWSSFGLPPEAVGLGHVR